MKLKIHFLLIAPMIVFGAALALEQNSEEQKLAALADLRREFACYCGCSLTVEDCLRSMRCSESAKLSSQVQTLFDAGKNRTEIVQAMVAQYSESILSAPTKRGFNLAAWILPFAAIGLGVIAAAMVVKRWRSQTVPALASASTTPAMNNATTVEPPADPYARQVEEELKKLER